MTVAAAAISCLLVDTSASQLGCDKKSSRVSGGTTMRHYFYLVALSTGITVTEHFPVNFGRYPGHWEKNAKPAAGMNLNI